MKPSWSNFFRCQHCCGSQLWPLRSGLHCLCSWFFPPTLAFFFVKMAAMKFQLSSFICLHPIRRMLGVRAFAISRCLSALPGSVSADIEFSRTSWAWISWMFTPLDERFVHRSSVDNLFAMFSFCWDGGKAVPFSFLGLSGLM